MRLISSFVVISAVLIGMGCEDVSTTSTARIVEGGDTIRFVSQSINNHGAHAVFNQHQKPTQSQNLGVVDNTFFAEYRRNSDGHGSLSFDLELTPTTPPMRSGDIRRLYVRITDVTIIRGIATRQQLSTNSRTATQRDSQLVVAEYYLDDSIVYIGGEDNPVGTSAMVICSTSSATISVSINISTKSWRSSVQWDFTIAP